jgi:phosphoglycolate phosphatase
MPRVDAVLFDLDGTLADSAPDLAGAANELRAMHGLAPLPFEQLRPLVGSGARGMVGVSFGVGPADERYDALKADFLRLYEARLLCETVVFPQVRPLLDRLAVHGLTWGIVTNKAVRLAGPLVQGLELDRRSAVLIGGDSTPFAKPHPEPLLEAARRLGLQPERCAYVGDDPRDIQAGRAAGMATLAAAWGYLGAGESVDTWGADAVIHSPNQLLNWLDLA